MTRILAFVALLFVALPTWAADLEKAKALRANGLLEDAKRELLELAFSENANPEAKAESLFLLGVIAESQNNPGGARQNWSRLVELYPSSTFAEAAKAKLQAAPQQADALDVPQQVQSESS